MTGGTIMGSTTAASGRGSASHETLRSLKGEGGHFFSKVFLPALGTAYGFRGLKDQGLKIMAAILAEIFKNRHNQTLLYFVLP
jgi:hypothetical protein